MTERLYRDDPYLLDFDARVLSRREHQGRPAVILDRTAFYAESGGQPWDTGLLGGVPVVAVVEDAGEPLHVLAAPLDEDSVHGQVDAARRGDHRQQHHGQHLLSRAFVEVATAATVSFHLGAETCSIDLGGEVSDVQVRAAEARVNQVVREARPVSVRTLTRAEATELGVRVPDEAGDAVRLVEARGFDLQPCGGTHPRFTSEVGVVLVVGHERYKGGSRVRFLCGERVLLAFRQANAVLDRLGVLLSASSDGLPDAAQRLLDNLAEATRRARELQGRAIEVEAMRLLAAADGAPAVVVAVEEGWLPADLRTLATQIVARAPGVALLASRAEKAYLVFAQSEGLGHDIPGLLREAASAIGGRGGGKGNLAQGGGELTDRLDEVLARAADAIRGAAPAR